MAGKLALAALVVLLAVLAAGWLSARAGDPDSGEPAPLTLHLEADSQVCTAGSFTEVRWEISGGGEPYEATLNGQPVDAPLGGATIACGAVLDIPDWLRGIIQPLPIDVALAVVDASGDAVRERLTLQAAPPFPARTARLYARFANDLYSRLGGETDVRTVLGVSVRESRTERDQERRYLVRWRPAGGAEWRYDAFRRPNGSNGWYDDWEHDTDMPGIQFEAQAARVRSFAERATPDLLDWSDSAYTTTESAPLDLTVRTTHDTISLSWGPTAEGLEWFVAVNHTRGQRRDGWEWERKPVGPDLPYRASYDGLLPDTLYVVEVRPGVGALYAPVVWLSVRTEPAPPDWTREPWRPQNVQIEQESDGIVVTWDPPAEGPERAYEVYVHEYGAPRSRPIVPATGTRRVFSRQAWRYSTSEVIVRHLGVEGAETAVVREPQPPSSAAPEQTRTMTLPDWQVEHRQSTGGDGCDGYKFVASWDALREGERLQLRWRKDGYTMTRSAQRLPILICTAEPGPYPFELRLRDKDGFWSQWSSTLWASAKPSPPRLVDVREQVGMLVASWDLPERWYPRGDLNDQIDGFRAYLYRAGEMEQMLDVGAATRAEFLILADGGEYEVHVTSYSDEFGEGPATIHTFSQADGPRLDLIGHWSDGWPHVCDPQWEIPSVARWFIVGGAAPYTLRVTGGQTVPTNEHAGYIELTCDARLESDSSVAEVTVIDAYGRSDAQQVEAVSDDLVGMLTEYYADRYTRWPADGLPFSVEGLAFDGVSIHREALWLSWNRYADWRDPRFRRFAPSFIVRWRETGAAGWFYRKVDDVDWNWPKSSKWRLGDLTPDTEYEAQIAAYWTEDELAHPDQLSWAESVVSRTLPASIPTNVYRRGHDVIVSWASIPEAWAYLVTIDADGASWWKDYQPNGKPVEEAVFRDVPTEFDATLRVSVITPPGSGDGRRKPGFDIYERIWPH